MDNKNLAGEKAFLQAMRDSEPERPPDNSRKWKYLISGVGFYIALLVSALVLAFFKGDVILKKIQSYQNKNNDVIHARNIKIDKLEKENKSLADQIKDLSLKNSMLIKKIANTKKNGAALRDRGGLLERENILLKERLAAAGKIAMDLKKNRDGGDLKNKLLNTLSKLNTIKKENEDMNTGLANLKKSLNEAEQINNNLTSQGKNLRDELELLKSALASSEKKELKAKTEQGKSHYNLGYIYRENKMFKEAIKEYNRALELDPADPEAHYNIAIIYDDYLDENELAVKHYRKYLQLRPDAKDAEIIKRWMEKADEEGL